MTIAFVYRLMDAMVMDVDETHIAQLKSAFPNDTVVFARSLQQLKDQGIRAECIIGGHPTLEAHSDEINFTQYCRWAGSVKWFHTMFTGVDAFLNDAAFFDYGVRLTNSGGISAITISEQIMAYALCFARCFPTAFRQKAERVWARPTNADELNGKTMGIIGLGNIGKATAKKAKAFQMRVLGYKRTPVSLDYVDKLYHGEDGLFQLLRQSDYVVMLLPATPATHRIMDDSHFAAMKNGAYFINNGRGSCVDTAALIHALQSGKLAGAALDALDPEPLPPSSPLWDMDNVIITAHYGGDGQNTFRRSIDLFIQNMNAYRQGLPMKNEIDLHSYIAH